ncbi:pali-domain-containing protein [Flagelloscypha sp. PMI_526]|nr:pali-domain-containing protein [Flagelloscypha sp. PMI_526]
MTRIFCIPGIIFLAAAFVLNALVSISLPFLTALDIARTSFPTTIQLSENQAQELRFGIWTFCTYDQDGDRTCKNEGHGYSVNLRFQDTKTNDTFPIVIGSSWTRGLAVHPVAAGVTFIALVMSFSTHITVTLVCSLVSFFAAFLTFLAFIIDIALFAYAKDKLGDAGAHTKTGPGFWLTFVSFILLLLAGCTVCFGRRKGRMDKSDYPMTEVQKPWYQRFRRGAGHI